MTSIYLMERELKWEKVEDMCKMLIIVIGNTLRLEYLLLFFFS